MEADAHLGLANRLAAPFAQRVFLVVPDRGPRRAEVPRHRPADPGAARAPTPRDEARRAVRAAAQRAACCSSSAAARARAASTSSRSRRSARPGPPSSTSRGERDYERAARRASRATTTGCCRSPTTSAPRSRPPTSSLARAGGSVWELAAAGKPAILVPYPYATADHQTKNARYFERAGGAIVVPETELGRVPELVALAARRPGAPREDGASAMLAVAAAGRGRRRSPRS